MNERAQQYPSHRGSRLQEYRNALGVERPRAAHALSTLLSGTLVFSFSSVFSIPWTLDAVHCFQYFVGRECPYQPSTSSCLVHSARSSFSLIATTANLCNHARAYRLIRQNVSILLRQVGISHIPKLEKHE